MSVVIMEVLDNGFCRSIRDDCDSLERVMDVMCRSYRDAMQMRRLMHLGNIRSIGDFVQPFEGRNNFVFPLPNVTLSYERDAGDERWPMHNYNSLDDALFFSWSDYGSEYAVINNHGAITAVKLERNDV